VGHATTDRVDDSLTVDNDRRMTGTFLSLIIISLPIAGILLYFATAGRSTDSPSSPTPPAVQTSAASEPKPAIENSAPSASQTPAAPAPASMPTADRTVDASQPAARAPAPVTSAAADRLIVALSAKSTVFVSATVDGAKALERVLQPGEQQTIEVRREMVLTAGDASALTLTFNGVEGKPLGKAGEVVTARFNPANYKTYVQTR
jgi:cytoskeletal protein RodZ